MKRILWVGAAVAGCNSPAPGTCPPHDSTNHFYVDTADLGDSPSCDQLCAIAMANGPVYPIVGCQASTLDLGVASVECTTHVTCLGGRRPGELVRGTSDGELVGRWLAEAAQLEAASVPAFEILARELAAHDAPPSLIARALASADDERRHARIMTSLARAHGATPGPVRVVVREPRDLEAIARENAVEGLVREAYGARVAIDPVIAVDEQRHADLAADVHAWIRARLPYAARLRVDEARDAARAQLVAECAVELPRAVRDTLGPPDATRAVELARAI